MGLDKPFCIKSWLENRILKFIKMDKPFVRFWELKNFIDFMSKSFNPMYWYCRFSFFFKLLLLLAKVFNFAVQIPSHFVFTYNLFVNSGKKWATYLSIYLRPPVPSRQPLSDRFTNLSSKRVEEKQWLWKFRYENGLKYFSIDFVCHFLFKRCCKCFFLQNHCCETVNLIA